MSDHIGRKWFVSKYIREYIKRTCWLRHCKNYQSNRSYVTLSRDSPILVVNGFAFLHQDNRDKRHPHFWGKDLDEIRIDIK